MVVSQSGSRVNPENGQFAPLYLAQPPTALPGARVYLVGSAGERARAGGPILYVRNHGLGLELGQWPPGGAAAGKRAQL